MSYNTVIVTVLLIIFITLNYARNKLMIKKVNNKNLHYDKWLTILSTLPQIDSITITLSKKKKKKKRLYNYYVNSLSHIHY